MNTEHDFGTWLAAALERRGLNQSQLARRLGVATGTVNRWVNEGRRPASSAFEGLARELGVSVDEVMLAAGVIEVERARIGPRARLLDLISWLPDQEVEAVLAFAEFRGERARSAMRSARIVTNEDTGVDGGSTMASREVGGS